MTDQAAAHLDEALEQVIAAARAHLAAVKSADGAIDDAAVWRSYVTLNNASFAYDQMLLDRYGEVTPWETEEIDTRVTDESTGMPLFTTPSRGLDEAERDPYPAVISVRQRRDYRVPSLSALLAVAEETAQRLALDDEIEPPASVADAVLELVRDGDGSLAGLDLPELEPVAGVVTVTEVDRALEAGSQDSAGLFQVGPADRIVGRLDEEPFDEPFDEPDDGDADEDGGPQ